jgi:hypothetical protein
MLSHWAAAMSGDKTTQSGELDSLRGSLAEVLRHQVEMAQHQQEVRDRWYRYYLITAGAIVSLFGLLVTTLVRSDLGKDGRTLQIVPAELVISEIVTLLVLLASGVILVLGVLFLAVYMTQVVSYHVNYLVIARVYECYLALYADQLIQYRLPNPFAFHYGRYEPPRGLRRAFDPQLWAADFWSNCIPMFLNSVCLGVFVLLAFARPATWLFGLHQWVTFFSILILAFVGQVTFRQVAVAWAMNSARRSLDTRWPIHEPTLVSDKRAAEG